MLMLLVIGNGHYDSSASHLQTRFDLPEFLSWSRWNLCCLLSETSWSKSSTRVNCPRQKPEYSAAPPSEVNTRDLGVSSESTEASSESSFSSCPLKGLLVSSGAGGGGAESMTVFEQADHLGWVWSYQPSYYKKSTFDPLRPPSGSSWVWSLTVGTVDNVVTVRASWICQACFLLQCEAWADEDTQSSWPIFQQLTNFCWPTFQQLTNICWPMFMQLTSFSPADQYFNSWPTFQQLTSFCWPMQPATGTLNMRTPMKVKLKENFKFQYRQWYNCTSYL